MNTPSEHLNDTYVFNLKACRDLLDFMKDRYAFEWNLDATA
jgi:hypothetical protein